MDQPTDFEREEQAAVPEQASGQEKPAGVSVKDRRKYREGDDGPSPQPVDTAIPEDSGAEVTKLRVVADGYLDDLQRLKAEFDNYRKRVLREQTALADSASAAMIARLLGVMDNFELAVAAAEETKDFDKMLKGVEMVFGELKEVLRLEGLETIDAKNQPFDPNFHEAALEVPGDDSGHTVVADVLRSGYKLNGKVLRPAMVKVTQRAQG